MDTNQQNRLRSQYIREYTYTAVHITFAFWTESDKAMEYDNNTLLSVLSSLPIAPVADMK